MNVITASLLTIICLKALNFTDKSSPSVCHQQNSNSNRSFEDSSLKIRLAEVLLKDQFYRNILERLQKSPIEKKDSIVLISDIIVHWDSVNVLIVEDIIARAKKWPGIDLVGDKGNQTVFLVMQHTSTNTQKKYLPLFKKSVKEGKTPKFYYPYLIDRMLINTGKKQKFGTQADYDTLRQEYISLPLKYLKRVNRLRDRYGLGPIEQYLKALNGK